jgi:S-DNA-T family DNA segregation ATPase FtsK/SpoIIIE
MLLMSPSSMVIERVQGAFVPDGDIRKIVEFVCGQAKPSFNSAVLTETAEDDGEIDELDLEEPDDQDRADIAPLIKKYLRPSDGEEMRKALEVVILDRKVSTSYLQRRLKIGYNRAAEIVDELEARHVVGPPSGSGNKREILIFDGTDFADREDI